MTSSPQSEADLVRSATALVFRAPRDYAGVASVSFEVMDRLALPAAFTFDRNFRDCGYRMVP